MTIICDFPYFIPGKKIEYIHVFTGTMRLIKTVWGRSTQSGSCAVVIPVRARTSKRYHKPTPIRHLTSDNRLIEPEVKVELMVRFRVDHIVAGRAPGRGTQQNRLLTTLTYSVATYPLVRGREIISLMNGRSIINFITGGYAALEQLNEMRVLALLQKLTVGLKRRLWTMATR